MNATLDLERQKYWKLWKHKAYRQNSPGQMLAAYFRANVQWQRGDTLVDLGCGTGRAGALLGLKGFKVTLIDFVDALDDDIRRSTPFIEMNLCQLEGLPVFDWIYCADVMEHIPPEYVDQTLDGMARITRKGGIFSISHKLDGYGKLVNERLHLTIQNSSWWGQKLLDRWELPKSEPGTGASIYIVGKPRERFYNA